MMKKFALLISILSILGLILINGCSKQLKEQKLDESKKSITEKPIKKQKTVEKWTKNSSILMPDTTSTCTLTLNNKTYRMYFMAEGAIFYAESPDSSAFGAKKPTGITQSIGKMISNPAVLKISNNDWIMIYEEQPQKKPGQQGPGKQNSAEFQRNLYLAISKDGKTFQKAGMAVDSSKEDDFFASVPELVKLSDGQIRMYYVSGGEATGSAISQDNGRSWKRESGYRLEDLAVDPEVLYENGQWIMYYAELAAPGKKNAIYKATSADGLTWDKDNIPLIEPDSEEGFVVDPDVIKVGNSYRMFFGEAGGGLGAEAQRINLFYADKD